MARTAAADWTMLKQEYIGNNTVTYQALAKKHGVSERTIKRHAVQEGWQAARNNIAQQVTNNVTKRAIENLEEVNERHTKAYKNLQAFALTNLNILYDHIKTQQQQAKEKNVKLNPRDVYNSQQAKFLAETLRVAMDGERITLGLPTVVTKGEQDVNLTSEFANKDLNELEKLYRAADEPAAIDAGTSKES